MPVVLAYCWYATDGHDPADVTSHRARSPWYITKTQPSTADMAAKLRRVIIAARFRPSPTSQHAKKYTSSPWPGQTSPHNREVERGPGIKLPGGTQPARSD